MRDYRNEIRKTAEEKRPLMYEQKFFAQGDDAEEYMNILDEKGVGALINYLSSAGAFQNEGEMSVKPHHGANDNLKKLKGGWIVSWNYNIPYIGIELVHEGYNPDAWVSPEEAEAAEKMKEHNRILDGSSRFNKTAQETIPPKQKIPYEVWIKSRKSDGTSYEQWEKRLDRIISNKFGLGMLDFPDWRSGDAYEQNKTVEQGFNAFKRAQKDNLGDLG